MPSSIVDGYVAWCLLCINITQVALEEFTGTHNVSTKVEKCHISNQ